MSAQGCINLPVTLSDSTYPITDDIKVTEVGATSSSSVGVVVFYILPLMEPKPMKAMKERALAKSGGDAIIDLTVSQTFITPFIFPVIITWSQLEGKAVKLSTLSGDPVVTSSR